MRQHLKAVLQVIGVHGPDHYYFPSFRRGAVFHASNQGVPDCVIKKKIVEWVSDSSQARKMDDFLPLMLFNHEHVLRAVELNMPEVA